MTVSRESKYRNSQIGAPYRTAKALEPCKVATAMVLATQVAEQNAAVRILPCGPAGQLAVKAYQPAPLKSRNVIPNQMMVCLIKGVATVEVCALFLANADKTPAELIVGVSVAKPPEDAAYMVKPGGRAFGFRDRFIGGATSIAQFLDVSAACGFPRPAQPPR